MARVASARRRATRSRRLLVVLASRTALSLACSDDGLVTDPVAPAAPAFTIVDDAQASADAFYWLPPIAEQPPVTSGTFDGALSPVVEICARVEDACAPGMQLLERFTLEGTGRSRLEVDPDDEMYIANWRIGEYDVTTSVHYRISVFAGPEVLLGYADIELDSYEILPISFRVETGFPARLEIAPGAAAVTVGGTQQFTATVVDLRGDVLPASVSWASDDESVAVVSGLGLATGVGPGSAAIVATAEGLSASAALSVEPDVEVPTWAQVIAGGDHSCGVSTDGDAYCWGWGAVGQVGNGGTADRLTPVAVAGGLTFAFIGAGLGHTCALTPEGTAYCWGLGGRGQLGNGGAVDETSPVAVTGDLRFTSIAAGSFHTCALTTDGDAYCWGEGVNGQLGNGGTDLQSTPTLVAGGYDFTSITAGSRHSCGVTTAGDAFCWGDAFFGALGDGGGSNFEPLPVAVVGDLTFESISARGSHTCGVTTDGAAYCWGEGSNGRLGNGGTTIRQLPVAVLGGFEFAEVAAGRTHTCGVTTAGEALCWGNGGLGMLGYGGSSDQLVPAPVAGNRLFASVSTSSNFHTCGMTTDGEAYCWGRGQRGQMGNGRTSNQLVPSRVSDPF